MQASLHLAETIRAFHLDKPEATWHELREHLIWVAEGLLSSVHEVHSLRLWGDLYEDVTMNLTEIAATLPLNVDQHKGRKKAVDDEAIRVAVSGGLSFRKTAEALGVSLSSVQRALKQ